MKIMKKALVEGLSYALDIAENNYLSHAKRVTYISLRLAYLIGETDYENLFYAALIHDIGAGNAYGLKEHSQTGAQITGKLPLDPMVSAIIKYHHEKLNGTGYPYGFTHQRLDRFSRTLSIVDIYQALTEERPYRQPMSSDKAWLIIKEMAAKKELDGQLVDRIIALADLI